MYTVSPQAFANITCAFQAGWTLPVADLLQVYGDVTEVLPDPARSEEVSRLLGKYERSVYGNLVRAWELLQDWIERAERSFAPSTATAIQTSARRFLTVPAEYERQLGWTPLNEIPNEMRGFIRALRNKFSELYDCVVPKYGDEITPGFRNSLRRDDNPICRAIRTGEIVYSNSMPARRFWSLMIRLFFGLQRSGDKLLPAHVSNEDETLIYHAIETKEGWIPLERIPKARREFVKLLRRQAIRLFGGSLPPTGFETVDGWKSGELKKNPLNQALKDGTITYSQSNTRQKFIADSINVLLGVKFIDGKYYHVEIGEDVQIAIYSMVSAEEKWVPIDEIQQNLRKAIVSGRNQLIALFGGKLPPKGFKTTDGWRTGDLHNSPINNIFATGVVQYSSKKKPSKLRKDLENYLFGVQRTRDGYIRIPITADDAKMLDEFERVSP